VCERQGLAGFWLEKNNEGWGPITILRVILKNAL